MASVRIEESAFSDARIDLLGTLAGYNRYEALGRLANLWRLCTQRGLYVISEALVRATLGENGVDAILGSELGERCEHGIRVRGTQGRIEWLNDLKTRSRRGGLTRSNNALRQGNGQWKPATDQGSPGVLPGDCPGDHPGRGPGVSSPLTLTPTLTLTNKTPIVPTGDVSPPGQSPGLSPGKRKRTRPAAATEPELATVRTVLDRLSSHNGVRYSGSVQHAELIVARLREGLTETDLRCVVGYCAVELDWKSKPEMAQYLRPETLFGPKTIARYLDPARTWAEKQGLLKPQLGVVIGGTP